MFIDTESEVSRVAEVAAEEFVFLHLEASLNELHGLFAANGNIARDLFVTTDSPLTDSVTGLTEHWGLSSELF